jgi:hypothetical protein
MAVDELFLDMRLREKALQAGNLTEKELAKHLKDLTDMSDNIVRFDEDGNTIDAPEVELKEILIKPGPPEPQNPEPPKPETPLLEDLGLE